MLEKIAASFPRRPLKLGEASLRHKLFSVFTVGGLFLIMAGMGGGIFFWMLGDEIPGIQRDFEIAKDAERFNPLAKAPSPLLRKSQPVTGECSTRIILVECKTKLHYIAADNRPAQLAINFSLIDFRFGDYEAAPVRSASRPEMMTIDLAINTLWQRVLFVVLMTSLGVVLVLMAPFSLLGSLKIRRKMLELSGKALHPVSLRITKQAQGHIFYKFETPSGVKKYKALFVKEKPFMLGDSEMLGVVAAGSDYAYPLDDVLRRLDFTDAERAAIFKAASAES